MIAVFKQGKKKVLSDLLSDYDEDDSKDHGEGLKQLMRWYNESVKDDEGHGCFVINVLVGWGHGRFQRGLKGENYFDVESKKNIVDVPSE